MMKMDKAIRPEIGGTPFAHLKFLSPRLPRGIEGVTPETVLNLRYRFRRAVTDIEQTDVSIRWPLTDRLAMVGRWNYSLQENRSLETIWGLEYESCCWGARLIGRRFLRNTQGEFENGFFMLVHFRGLGGCGQDATALLRRGIPGYVDPFD